MAAVDLVSEARWKVLALDVLVEHLVASAQEDTSGKIDERIMVLVYAVETASKEAMESVERARTAMG